MSLSSSVIGNMLWLLIGCGEHDETGLNSPMRESKPRMQCLSHSSARPIQTAKIMGISRSQVYVLMNRGELGSVNIGRSRRITRQQMDQFIQNLIPA